MSFRLSFTTFLQNSGYLLPVSIKVKDTIQVSPLPPTKYPILETELVGHSRGDALFLSRNVAYMEGQILFAHVRLLLTFIRNFWRLFM